MSLPLVKDFFKNKVTIQLKSGQKFQGLLSQVDYKKEIITLEDVQDLGNSNDKNFIPHDKKIAQKIFQQEQISQILFQQKHFSQPKKYKQQQFWDAISQPVGQKKYKQKNYQDKQRQDNYRGNRGRGGYYKKNNEDRDYRDKRQHRDNREYRDNRNYQRKNYEKQQYKGKGQNNDQRDYR